MASLIKNQIVKQLSIFAKNITADKISLEVLRGKGELRNIVLNEDVLSEKLELPPWLRIKHASCNRVAVQIPWTSLKSSPVVLRVDEIEVEIELCADNVEEFVQKRGSFTPTSYGFGDRVVEGMSIFVNSVEIKFTSDRFVGSVMFSRLEVVSQSPNWKHCADLKMTRFSDHKTKKVVNFKLVSWQLLRVEAKAVESGADNGKQMLGSGLRLITNQGSCRITIKKSSVDGSLVCGRMQTILEEVLWIATLPQLRSAILFGQHILDLINRSSAHSHPSNVKSINSSKTVNEESRWMAPNYRAIDFIQSSNHLYINKIDMHLVDDGNAADFPDDWNIDNGAMQVALMRLSMDIYPSDTPLRPRDGWVRYDASNSCASEAEKLILTHLAEISKNLNDADLRQFKKVYQQQLRSQNIVIRIDDLLVYCVSQQSSKKESLRSMVTPDNAARQTLPQQMPIFHMELASYYYLNPSSFPVPRAINHIVLGPLSVLVDPRSVRWLIYVAENISNLVDLKTVTEESEPCDLKVELLLPCFMLDIAPPEMDGRFPTRLVLNFCTITAANYFYRHCQLSETDAFGSLCEKSTEYASKYSDRLVDHVRNAQDLLLLKNQADEKFLLIKCNSLNVHTEIEGISCQYQLSNDFSLNVYLVEEESQILVGVDLLGTVQLAVDHYQFSQLMKLKVAIDKLLQQTKKDRAFFEQRYHQKTDQKKLMIYCLLDRVFLNLLLPPTPVPSPYDRMNGQMPTSDTDGSISSASLPAGLQNSSSAKLYSPSSNPSLASPDRRVDIERVEELTPSEFSTLDIRDDMYETASVITSTSDDEAQLQFLECAIGLDDGVFKSVPVAEEALEAEVCAQTNRESSRHLSQVVNAFEVQLGDTNVIIRIDGEDVDVNGYATSVQILERLKIRCADALRPNNALPPVDPTPFGQLLETKVHFEVVGREGNGAASVRLNNVQMALSDIIISHLGPFLKVEDQEEPDNFKLNVQLENSIVKIKEQQKPTLKLSICQMRIEIGDDAEENDAEDAIPTPQ